MVVMDTDYLAYWAVNRVYYYPGAIRIISNESELYLDSNRKATDPGDGYTYRTDTVYNSGVDPRQYGDYFGFLRRNFSGGDFTANQAIHAGSRSGHGNAATSSRSYAQCARGCNGTKISWGYMA